METSKSEIIVPEELLRVMETDEVAKEFFNSLSAGYKSLT